MQPTTNTFDSIRTQAPDYSKVFGTQDLPKPTQPMPPHNSWKVNKTPAQDTVVIGNKPMMSNSKKVLLALGALGVAVAGAIFAHKAISAKQVQQLAEHIEFKPAENMEDAIKFAKDNLGVNLKIGDNLPVANFINEQLVQISNFMKGKPVLPRKILIGKNIESSEGLKGYACWIENTHNMGLSKDFMEVFNLLSKKSNGNIMAYLKQLATDESISPELAECALQNLMVIPHELGHANHFAQCLNAKKGLMGTIGEIKAKKLNDTSITEKFLEDIKNSPVLQKILRPQAQTAPAEFCADKFAYDVLGIKCVPEVEELAIKYNAPRPV